MILMSKIFSYNYLKGCFFILKYEMKLFVFEFFSLQPTLFWFINTKKQLPVFSFIAASDLFIYNFFYLNSESWNFTILTIFLLIFLSLFSLFSIFFTLYHMFYGFNSIFVDYFSVQVYSMAQIFISIFLEVVLFYFVFLMLFMIF